MADKKAGLSRGTYILIAGGSVAAYFAYRWYQNRQALAAQTATTGGTSIPGITGSVTNTGATPPASLDQWIQDAISQTQYPQGYTNASLYNDIQSWLNGNCVSAQGYQIIGNLIESLGIPPGYTPPNLSACPSTPASPAKLHPGPGPSPVVPPIKLAPTSTPTAPAASGPSGLTYISNPTLAQTLQREGYKLVHIGGKIFYDPQQFGHPGPVLISNPTDSKALQAAGFKIVTVGHAQYYLP